MLFLILPLIDYYLLLLLPISIFDADYCFFPLILPDEPAICISPVLISI